MIDPYDRANHEVPLWVVYTGRINGAGMLCLKVSNATGTPAVWGYSVYRNAPGFRTLGISLRLFMEHHETIEFFADIDAALECLKKLATPSPKLVKSMVSKKLATAFHEVFDYMEPVPLPTIEPHLLEVGK